MNIQDQIKVMQHFANGGKVETRTRFRPDTAWVPRDYPEWDWAVLDYRIKQEPAVCWCNQFKDGTWGNAFSTKEQAEQQQYYSVGYLRKAVKFVEVMED